MSEWSQCFTLTENVGWGFILCSTPSPSQWRYLLRVLGPVRRPKTTLDCILLKDKSPVVAVGLGPEIKSGACRWVILRPSHLAKCWFVLPTIPTVLGRVKYQSGTVFLPYITVNISRKGPASWSSGQSFWLLITRFRVRFPALPWEFSL